MTSQICFSTGGGLSVIYLFRENCRSISCHMFEENIPWSHVYFHLSSLNFYPSILYLMLILNILF